MEVAKTCSAKEKPKYNVWQNTIYLLRIAFERKRFTPIVLAVQSLLATAIPTVAMFLPMTVVALILREANAGMLVVTVTAFTVAIAALQATKSYLNAVSRAQRNSLRHSQIHGMLDLTLTTDYVNLEKKAYTDAKVKAEQVTASPFEAAQQIYYSLENICTNVLGFVIYTILLVQINPLILLLTAATTAAGFFVRRKANKWRHDNDKEEAGYNKRTNYISYVGLNISIAKDIRLFAMFFWLQDVYKTYTKMRFNWVRRMESRQYIADVVDCLATFLREGAAYAYLIWLVLNNNLPVEQFVLLFAAIGGFSGWVMGILDEYSTLQRRSLEYCRLREFLEYPNSFKRDNGEPIAPEAGKTHELELRNVYFRYPGAEEDTLQNINLTIGAGEKLALVGLNGAGKTTLVKLLCGFYDPTNGEVFLDGKDIRTFNREQYYTLFTAVFQEFNILPLTIAENIAQQDCEELDKDRVKRCLELSGMSEKIDSLPVGMWSLLGKRVNKEAVELSGGETQRLVLARALYKDAPIMILDEPTAALDPIAESRLYNNYNDLSSGKTSVYISHRLASTRFCDRIVFIDDRTIAESGTHEELLAAEKTYAELFKVQSKYYQQEVDVDVN
ncbi:MAG: ABC transporter ATP-binding protein/permease [Oscillospiraceae bacterium]|nr:ABC transporter ATP-binding protein/permease [Oscillospiraceae bacterium]